mgnify:CR=1 FL=1
MRFLSYLLILTIGGCVLYVAPSFHLKGHKMQKKIKKRADGSRRVAFITDPGSRVEGHHKNDVDINNIMQKYRVTGFLESNADEAQYGDFTNATDYHDMKNRIIEAEMEFSRLPSHLRKRFNNDPGQLLSFLDDPQNLSEAQELGLCPKPIPDAPVEAKPPKEAPTPLVAAPGTDSAKPE